MKSGFYDRLIETWEQYGDVCLVCDEKEELRVSDLLSGADSFCERLLSMGVKRGDHVALCADNSCTWLKAFLGIVKCGAVAVLMNSMLDADELRELSSDMDSVCFLYGKCSALMKDAAFIDRVQPDTRKQLNIDSLICRRETVFFKQSLNGDELKKPAFIIFTSGSTGKPKGSMISQLCNINGADALNTHIADMKGESLCLALPLFHIFGLSLTMAHILNGGKLIIPPALSAEAILKTADAFRPDAIGAVMTVITRLTEHPDFEHSTASHCIRTIYTGGAQLMPIQLLRTERAFDNAVVLNCYGQSESDSAIAMTAYSDSFDNRVYTVGKPLRYRQVSVMDSSGNMCPTGMTGEIVVKADENICCGYYKLDADRQPVQNGWLHTGDIGFLDESGYLHLAGRIKDIIIKGGENILPSAIEREIFRIEGVREVKVMGAPNELYGESIEACVTLLPDCSLDENDLRTRLREFLPSFRQPSHFFVFDSFPLKANGKTDTCELKVQMLSRLNARLIEEEIGTGIEVLSLSAKSRHYMISPLCRAIFEVISNFGFTREKAERIRLCIEELLTERTNLDFLSSGELNMELRLYRDYMRVFYWDEKTDDFLLESMTNTEKNISARIILGFTDRLCHEKKQDGTVKYCFDYIYDREFDASSFFSC